jgi:hypothetical protein
MMMHARLTLLAGVLVVGVLCLDVAASSAGVWKPFGEKVYITTSNFRIETEQGASTYVAGCALMSIGPGTTVLGPTGSNKWSGPVKFALCFKREPGQPTAGIIPTVTGTNSFNVISESTVLAGLEVPAGGTPETELVIPIKTGCDIGIKPQVITGGNFFVGTNSTIASSRLFFGGKEVEIKQSVAFCATNNNINKAKMTVGWLVNNENTVTAPVVAN